MNTLTKEYLFLFNTLTHAEEALQLLREELMEAQRQAEELYMAGSPTEQDSADHQHSESNCTLTAPLNEAAACLPT